MNKNMKIKGKKKQNTMIMYKHIKQGDDALTLKPEFKGQPVMAVKLTGFPVPITTTVGAGYSAVVGLQKSNIPNFATRFAGFTEFRVIKAKAKFRNFSSQNAGICNFWFSEDNSAAPTSSASIDERAKRFNFSDITKDHSLEYTPHDPAQQTWTTIASGDPVIGYLKIYTNIVEWGCPSAATTIGHYTIDYTVQLRGFI